MATFTPSSAAPGSYAPVPPGRAPRTRALCAAAFAGLALVAVVVSPGYHATPVGSPARGAGDLRVSSDAVATFAAWPQVTASVGDDEYEVRGERQRNAVVVPAEFRAFQACRQRTGG